MSCSVTQNGDAYGDRTQALSIRSPTLYYYAIALPKTQVTLNDIIKTDRYKENKGLYIVSVSE